MKLSLSREIILILCFKIIALLALWYFFIDGHEVMHGAEATYSHLMKD